MSQGFSGGKTDGQIEICTMMELHWDFLLYKYDETWVSFT